VAQNYTCLHRFFGAEGGEQCVHMTDRNTLVLQSCTDAPRVERGLCSETGVLSSDVSIEVIFRSAIPFVYLTTN